MYRKSLMKEFECPVCQNLRPIKVDGKFAEKCSWCKDEAEYKPKTGDNCLCWIAKEICTVH